MEQSIIVKTIILIATTLWLLCTIYNPAFYMQCEVQSSYSERACLFIDQYLCGEDLTALDKLVPSLVAVIAMELASMQCYSNCY